MVNPEATREFFRLQDELRRALTFRHFSRMGSSMQRSRYNYLRSLLNDLRRWRQLSGAYPRAKGPKQKSPSRVLA